MGARGFLGTNANILQDCSLLFGILVALTLTAGVIAAVRKRYELHRRIQTTAVALNILQVLVIMVGSFMKSAAPGIPQQISQPFYYTAALHGALGLATLLFGTFVMLRGNELVPRALAFNNYKLFMRTAYGLYMLVTLLGVWVYYTWYVAAPEPAAAPQAQPVAQRSDELNVPMANFEFNPKEIIIPVGTTVIWTNQDGAPHTATSDDGTLFRSELLSAGQQFRHTFDKVGEFPYYCELHGSPGGVDMAGVIKVVPADQAPQLAAAPSVAPQPTQAPTAPPLPAQPLGQPLGTAAFRDDKARSDQIVLEIRLPASPASGQTLMAFLTTPDGSASQSLGALPSGAQTAQLSFSAPGGENLAARYSRVVITQAPDGGDQSAPSAQVVLAGELPQQALGHMRQLLADGPGLPSPQGYASGLHIQTDELLRHATFVANAQAGGDLEGLRRHAEHVYNLIAGSRDPQFGDLNGDGHAQNPGDGIGLLENGDQAGYLKLTLDAATAAKDAPDASAAIKVHAEHVRICVQNMQGWAKQAQDLARALTQARSLDEAQAPAAQLLILSREINLGSDVNGDGQIAPVPGEGGAQVAYEHAQFMAGIGLFSSQAGAASAQGLAAPAAHTHH